MLEALKNKSVLVVGDFVIDHYRHLEPVKVSPEAPIVVFSNGTDEFRAGGSANVAVNMAAMGAQKVFLLGVVGLDYNPVINFESKGVTPFLVPDISRMTTVKERLVNGRHQIARIDTKKSGYVSNLVAERMLNAVSDVLRAVDVIVFSDYQHGALPYPLCRSIINSLNGGVPVVVDTKSPEVDKYAGADVALPNHVEAKAILGEDAEDWEVPGLLLEEMKVKAIGMTMGAKGILLHDETGEWIFPSLDVGERAIDATGAGDVVTASVASCLACGTSLSDAMIVANIAAGISVTKWGTSVVPIEELEPAITKDFDRLKREVKDV
jgi:D-beta-D-heptose 7-phosphate kinase/D-beta-D-heptose 1-phosphate adenosyltransferase